MTEAEAAFMRGDDAGLESIYRAHGALIYTLCRRNLPDDRASEVTQDVFVSAWKARTRFDPDKGGIAAWLTGIAKNRIVDNLRAEQRIESVSTRGRSPQMIWQSTQNSSGPQTRC